MNGTSSWEWPQSSIYPQIKPHNWNTRCSTTTSPSVPTLSPTRPSATSRMASSSASTQTDEGTAFIGFFLPPVPSSQAFRPAQHPWVSFYKSRPRHLKNRNVLLIIMIFLSCFDCSHPSAGGFLKALSLVLPLSFILSKSNPTRSRMCTALAKTSVPKHLCTSFKPTTQALHMPEFSFQALRTALSFPVRIIVLLLLTDIWNT